MEVGLSSRVEIDWESVISELWPAPPAFPHEGLLFALQVMAVDPLRWSAHMPLLFERLEPFQEWLFPYPPSPGAGHLNLALHPGDVAQAIRRFDAVRHQCFRLLGGQSALFAVALRASFEALLEPLVCPARPRGVSEFYTHLDALKLSDAKGLSYHEAASPYEVRLVTTQGKTTFGQELAAILRGERFGAVKDHNYLVVRHAGLAEHLEAIGDTTPFHTAEVYTHENPAGRTAALAVSIRRTLRDKFRAVSDVTACRVFARIPNLRGARYTPQDWSVFLRADVSRSLRELGETARRRREATPHPKALRSRRVAQLDVPEHLRRFADKARVLWRHGAPYVDAGDLKLPEPVELAGLSVGEFVAFDLKGRVTHDPALADVTYLHRQAVSRRGLDVFAKWLGVAVPTYAAWRALLNKDPDKRRVYKGAFSRDEDAELLRLWKKYQSKKVWEAFEKSTGHPAKEARRRAEYVAFACRRRNLTVSELNDLATVEQRLGPVAWKKWRVVARRARA